MNKGSVYLPVHVDICIQRVAWNKEFYAKLWDERGMPPPYVIFRRLRCNLRTAVTEGIFKLFWDVGEALSVYSRLPIIEISTQMHRSREGLRSPKLIFRHLKCHMFAASYCCEMRSTK